MTDEKFNPWNKQQNVQHPKVTEETGPTGGTRYEHPAFAQIRASRVTGGAYLYGSDFKHHGYIEITLCESSMRRDLSHDWPFAGKEITSVKLSEAQWATFVSSLNAGMGVPCTLQHVNMVPVPGIPPMPRPQSTFADEMEDIQNSTLQEIKDIAKKVEAMGLPVKKTGELLHSLRVLHDKVKSNIPFVNETFGKSMEATTEKAKMELTAYANQIAHQTGINVLSGGILGLGHDKPEGSDNG